MLDVRLFILREYDDIIYIDVAKFANLLSQDIINSSLRDAGCVLEAK